MSELSRRSFVGLAAGMPAFAWLGEPQGAAGTAPGAGLADASSADGGRQVILYGGGVHSGDIGNTSFRRHG